MEPLTLDEYMRKIDPRESEIISLLARAGGIQLTWTPHQLVWVVNPEMRSIRADYCPKGRRVHSMASGEFDDSDGVPVIVTLLLTNDGKFGELDFWKVNDEPVLDLPASDSAFRQVSSQQS